MSRPRKIAAAAGLIAGLTVATFIGSPAWAVTGTTPGALRSASTLQSIGLEWDIAGDDDHDATVTVAYRAVGDAAWQQAMPLVRVDNVVQNGLAGSILFLTPGTSYEISLNLLDPDGGTATRTLTVTTKSPPTRPNGRALIVIPGSGGGDGTAGNPYRGVQAAWAAAQPGDVLLLRTGNYGGVRDTDGTSGVAGNPIMFKAYGDGPVVFDFLEVFRRSYLWFEGLTFTYNGTSDTALYSSLLNPGYDTGFQPMPADIRGLIVVRNTFTGYKHAVRAGPRTDGWTITDNAIQGDKAVLGGNDIPSFDGEGIELGHGSNHIVAYNSITRTADGISFPSRNCDIYGNDIFDVTDDGIELDGGGANTRAWGNRIHNAGHNGIAFQPQEAAPWYIVRNQIANMQESVFKFREADRFVVAHNTLVNWGAVLDHWSWQLLGGVTRNNLWISVNDGPIWLRGSAPVEWRTNHDYDGFDWGNSAYAFGYDGAQLPDLASLVAATGQQTHGVRIDHRTCFDSFNVPGPPPFTTVPPHVMTLRATCPAVNAGIALPNLSDGYTGAAPDMGAHELGHAPPRYGPRPAVLAPPTGLRVQ